MKPVAVLGVLVAACAANPYDGGNPGLSGDGRGRWQSRAGPTRRAAADQRRMRAGGATDRRRGQAPTGGQQVGTLDCGDLAVVQANFDDGAVPPPPGFRSSGSASGQGGALALTFPDADGRNLSPEFSTASGSPYLAADCTRAMARSPLARAAS